MHIEPSVAFFSLISLFLIAVPLWQAVARRSVEGILSDSQGNPLCGAVVRLNRPRNDVIQSCVTDDRGWFHFEGLRIMIDYEIEVERDSRWSEPVKVWQCAWYSNIHLQFEPCPSPAGGTPLIALREMVADPHWFGVS